MTASPLRTGDRVAVVGGGPAGIVVAKELAAAGLEPFVLEQSAAFGGQWNAGAPHSAVWPGMRANTSGAMTRFGDRPVPERWPLFPRAEDVGHELAAYARDFGVAQRVRFGARVSAVAPAIEGGDGWDVTIEDVADGSVATRRFAAVVGCSGRFATPRRPKELDGFAARVRVAHAATYRGRETFRGRRVLVLGNSVSGLEIAADLAFDPSIQVISACRRPRWIIPKVARGVPADQEWFTAAADLAGRTLTPDALADDLRDRLRAAAGDPADVGGLTPDEDVLATGIAQAQHYLPLVAEGRIDARPALTTIDGDRVAFADGTSETIDAVVLATGYEVSLPYLAGLDLDALDGLTFGPERAGLAVMGQYVVHGPYFPVLELQARWIAAVWTGARALGDLPELPPLPFFAHHHLAGAFAEAAGCAPDLAAHPDRADALLFGPLLPERYRLDEPAAAARFRAATSGFAPTPEQVAMLEALAVAS
jgi:cation diffusion facilitator CzcD-associated flavoprotein CzcO